MTTPLSEPFYRYRVLRQGCYVIEDPLGDDLFGDQLPSSEDEARLLCRVANIAYDHAVRVALIGCTQAVETFARSLRP